MTSTPGLPAESPRSPSTITLQHDPPAIGAVDPGPNGGRRVPIDGDQSIVAARHEGRILALRLGFPMGAVTMVASAISELARNIVLYAGTGEIRLETLQPANFAGHSGLAIVASDRGPGIGDIRRALEDGYSTSGRMGMGLPGVRRLMDEFEVDSTVGGGTRVRVVKWRQR